MTARSLFALLILSVLGSAVSLAGWYADQGEAADDPQGNRSLRYVRVYVPTDRLSLEDCRDENVRYWPVAPDEFERLVSIAEKARPQDETLTAAAIVSARYTARLEADALVGGEAWIDVVHTAEGPVMLPLTPCGLAIGQAVWDEDGQAAKIGLGAKEGLAVLVERSGRLRFAWSLRGHRDAEDVVGFRWEAPASPTNCLVLDLPADMAPADEHGVVTEEGPGGEGTRRWRIEMGTASSLGLRLAPRSGSRERLPSTRVRQSTEYRFSLKGLDVSSRLELDVHGGPLEHLPLTLDPGLRLVKALYGDRPLRWAFTASSGEGGTGVVLEFPEPVQGMKRLVQLHALAPLQLDRRWKLPAIRPEGTFWEQGRGVFLVPAPLQLEQLVPIQGEQSSKIDSLASPRSGETVELQYFSPDATAEVVLTRPEASLHVDSGATIELGGGEVAAQIMADVWVAHGKRFQLKADVGRLWDVDSVEAVPEGGLADWSVEREGPTSRLNIQLAEALPQRLPNVSPVRLAIAARRVRSVSGKTLGITDLDPLRFRGATEGRRFVCLRAREPYELKVSGSEMLTRVDPQSLEATTLSLFSQSPRGLVFERDAGADGLNVSLEARKPGYSATIRIEATVSEDSLTESYELGCVPEGGRRVDRVRVHFSQSRTAPLRWEPGSDDEEHWSVHRVPLGGQTASGGASEGETWEIRLRPPRSVGFTIRATRTSPLADDALVGLASLPEARDQQGTVVVSSTGSAAVRIEHRRLTSVPADAVSAGRDNTVRAAFRYDPVRDAFPDAEATLSISRLEAEDAPATAWVWSCQLESQYEVSGIGRHVATYRLDTAGAKRLRLTLPTGVGPEDIHAVWVDDGQVAPRSVVDGAGGVLEVDLPPGRRFPVVSICLATVGAPLGVVDAVVPPLPETDVPMLNRHWTVWLPPGYEAHDPSLGRWRQATASLSWAQRLFGPLGRGSDSAPFDPLSLGDWRQAIGGSIPRRSAEEKAGALVRQLGELTDGDRSGQGTDDLDWGTLLTDESIQAILADRTGGRAGLELLIDRRALSRLGLAPHAPVPATYGEVTAGRGFRLLRRSHLTLLVHTGAIAVTSTTAAASYRAQLAPVENGKLAPLEGRALWWIGPGPLFDQIEQAAAGEPDGPFLPAYAWRQRPGDSPLPWSFTQPSGHGSVEPCGWTAYQLDVSGRLPGRLSLIRRDALRAFRWAAFLAAIGLAWWKAIHRPATLTVMLGLFGVAALLLPETYAQIASGALLGTLFVAGFRLIRPRRDGGAGGAFLGGSSPPPVQSKAAIGAGIAVGVVVTLLATHGSARCGEPGSKPRPAWWPAHGVLIPALPAADGQTPAMEPTGDKYQVPDVLYEALKRLAAAGAEDPQGWLLGGATYSGSLAWQPGPERLVPSEIKATFDLEVLGTSARVRIPFGEQGPRLLPDGVLLDGRAVQHEVDENALLFNVSDRGPHRLELALTPGLEPSGTSTGFDLAIPRLATARLELTVPPDAPALDVRSAVGIVKEDREAESARLTAELGPTDRLSVHWEQVTSRGSTGPVVEVEELLWLEVQRESVDLHARFKFQVGESQVRQLFLSVDPRLQRKGPFECDAGPIAEVPVAGAPGQPQTIGIELERPVSDRQIVLQATFHLKDRTGVGRLSLPHLRTQNARVAKRWLAVSVGPSLEHEQQGVDSLEPIAVPDFLSAWGEGATQPRFAYSLPPGERAPTRQRWSWSMSTRRSKPETTVEQTALWSFASREARVDFDARLSTAAGYHFQYRLSAPPELEIERISVLEGGEERADRWRHAPDGMVTVFLKRALSGDQTLSLQGRLPVPARGKLPLPVLKVEDALLQSSVIQLFRKREVQVDVGETTGLVAIEAPVVDESRASLGRLAAAFDADCAGKVSATLTLTPNRPGVHGEQITSLRSDGGLWEADVEFRLNADRGVIDEFRLRVPRGFDGPYRIDTPSTCEVEEADDRRWLLVQLVSAITGQHRFTVSSPLTLAPGERVSVPQVVLEGAHIDKRLLVLPTQSGLQPVAWETEGLRETALPEDSAAPLVAPEAFVAYQVGAGPFRASLRAFRGEPQVDLADVRVAWQIEGTCHGVALFDLRPGSLSECTLRLPAGCDLVQVTVDGVAEVPVRSEENRWLIPLGVSALPQRVGVLFQGTIASPDASGLVRLDAPTLSAPTPDGLAPRHTLWTVFGPSAYEPGRPQGLPPVTPLEQDLRRLQNVEALMEAAAGVTSDEPEEGDHWYRVWARRWVALCNRTMPGRLPGRRGEAGETSLSELLPLDRLPAAVAARLQSGNTLAQVAAETRLARDFGQLWLQTLDRAQPATRCIGQAGPPSIALRYRRAEARGFSSRLLGAAVLAGTVLLTVVGVRLGSFFTLSRRWPCLVGVLVGLGWWLWLWPSALGWGIVLVSVLASFRWGWKRPRQSGSAIVALTLPPG